MRGRFLLALLVLSVAAFAVAKKDRSSELQNEAMSRVRKIYVFDPHWFGYLAPGHIAKGIEKSGCLTLVADPSQADAVLAPIGPKKGLMNALDDKISFIRCRSGEGCTLVELRSSPGAWVMLDPQTGVPISNWSMDAFPSAKKVEAAVGCR